MKAALRSELRKLLTVRATYALLGLCVVICLVLGVYLSGWYPASAPLKIANMLSDQIGIMTVVAAIIVVLLVTHEYRYNTIMYTLTANRSRTSALLAKYAVASVFAVLFALFFGFLLIGVVELTGQIRDFPILFNGPEVWSVLWRGTIAAWGFVSLIFVFATIIRSQIGTIVALFLAPNTLEPLIAAAFKINQDYLPFGAIQILQTVDTEGHISSPRAILVLCMYVVVALAITWSLYLRRDAN